MKNSILENLSPEQSALSTRIFDLILGRVLKRVYLSLEEEDKKELEEIFISQNEKEKEIFFKKHLPNFKSIFKNEAKKLEEEIKKEMGQ